MPYLHIVYFVLFNGFLAFAGYVLVRKNQLLLSWLLLLASVVAAHFIFLNDAPLLRMLGLIAITFTATKAVTTCQAYRHKSFSLTLTQWLAFSLGWAGMRAEPFTTLGKPALKNAGQMVLNGLLRVLGGLALIFAAYQINASQMAADLRYILTTVCCLTGLSFILHFGLLAISAGLWRFSGADTYYLFRQPARSGSLQEFWGKRWNLAFIEMITIVVYRPLRDKIGNTLSLLIAFTFSGLLHELAISLPVKQGYGMPMLYFVVQAIGMWLERLLKTHQPELLANKVFAKVWLFFWLVAPFPILFHQAFIKEVVFPLTGIVR